MGLAGFNVAAKPDSKKVGQRVNQQGLIYRPITILPSNPDPGYRFY